MQAQNKEGRIHGRISRVRLGRSSDAKTARKMPEKTNAVTDQPMEGPTDQRTDQRTGTVGYRVECTRLKIQFCSLEAKKS